MLYIPIVGRLSLTDYVRLVCAFSILIFEPIFRLLFKLLPMGSLLNFAQRKLSKGSKPLKEADNIFATFKNTEDFISYWRFPFEPHFVTTRDGYILGLHRIPSSRSDPTFQGPKPVVLLWHGFLMCSEVFVCTPDPKLSLAFTLAQAGYDVWLGNSRGNKYSCKHRKLKPLDSNFWDFSFDQIAQYDLPDSVDYILKMTGQPSLSYIAFSQGTAQGFAALSLDKDLNKKINLFIALAPVTKPVGLENQGFNTLVRTSPDLIYLLFGRNCLMSFIIFWQSILPSDFWARMIDASIWFIFSWNSENIPNKEIVYKHLYSYSSVKCVVHWFQIISSQRFQMYDDAPTFLPNSDGHIVPQFPIESIQTPVALFYGKKDTLPDLNHIFSLLPPPVLTVEIKDYEHIHFLWANGLDSVVFPSILGLLAEYSEVWTEAKQEMNSSADAIKTVPWISQEMIRNSMISTNFNSRRMIRRSIHLKVSSKTMEDDETLRN